MPNHEATIIFKDAYSLEFAGFACDARQGSRERVQPLPLKGGTRMCMFCPEYVVLELRLDEDETLRSVRVSPQMACNPGFSVIFAPRP